MTCSRVGVPLLLHGRKKPRPWEAGPPLRLTGTEWQAQADSSLASLRFNSFARLSLGQRQALQS